MLRAMRAEKSVGSARASSRALVCSDCVPPCVAAIASMQVRATLLNTSCAVSDQPEVWQCVRSGRDLSLFGSKPFDELRPEEPRGAQLRHLHEEVHADCPEEGQARRELVDGEPGGEAGADVLDAVGERVGELQVLRRPGLLHVVAGDGDRVELRHVGRGVGEDVADDPHRALGRVDVGVPDHELLEDVVLDRARELVGRRRPAPRPRRCRARGRAARPRSWSSTRSSGRAGCRRTGCACRRSSRSPPPPCRRRRRRAGGRNRSRGGWRGRRRRRGPSGRRRGCAGRRRSNPRPWRSRRTAGSSRAGSRTWSGRGRADTAAGRGRCRGSRGRRGRRGRNAA